MHSYAKGKVLTANTINRNIKILWYKQGRSSQTRNIMQFNICLCHICRKEHLNEILSCLYLKLSETKKFTGETSDDT